jgi:hypothetical protein
MKENAEKTDLLAYCQNRLACGVFVFSDLLAHVLAANEAGLGKSAIVDILNSVLQSLEARGREEEFEVVAELVQRITGFFSPHGVIPLKDGKSPQD